MRKPLSYLAAMVLFSGILFSCNKELSGNESSSGTANVIFRFEFDSTQVRLDNIGQPSVIPAGHAAQSPVFKGMSAHYLELSPNMTTALGKGAVLYHASETTAGGTNAIDFTKIKVAANGETFLTVPVKEVPAGTYEWLRISLAYQNYDVRFRIDTTISGIAINNDFTGRVASFIGFNTYITNYTIANTPITVNGNRKQGYWGFESTVAAGGSSQTVTSTGQAPEGATTVPNPIFATSPIPQGSCVVTAAFAPGKLVITGRETSDVVITVKLSTNKSFEWEDLFANGRWEPLRGEKVMDMGIRGMIPTVQ